MQDSGTTGQDAQTSAGLGGARQDARLNGLMSLAQKRTAERDEAHAEIERLREQLLTQSMTDHDEPDADASDAEAGAEVEATSEDESEQVVSADGFIHDEDGGKVYAKVASEIAPTQPKRATEQPATSELKFWRRRFNDMLPVYASEFEERFSG